MLSRQNELLTVASLRADEEKGLARCGGSVYGDVDSDWPHRQQERVL
jgi:hypothetical protein